MSVSKKRIDPLDMEIADIITYLKSGAYIPSHIRTALQEKIENHRNENPYHSLGMNEFLAMISPDKTKQNTFETKEMEAFPSLGEQIQPNNTQRINYGTLFKPGENTGNTPNKSLFVKDKLVLSFNEIKKTYNDLAIYRIKMQYMILNHNIHLLDSMGIINVEKANIFKKYFQYDNWKIQENILRQCIIIYGELQNIIVFLQMVYNLCEKYESNSKLIPQGETLGWDVVPHTKPKLIPQGETLGWDVVPHTKPKLIPQGVTINDPSLVRLTLECHSMYQKIKYIPKLFGEEFIEYIGQLSSCFNFVETILDKLPGPTGILPDRMKESNSTKESNSEEIDKNRNVIPNQFYHIKSSTFFPSTKNTNNTKDINAKNIKLCGFDSEKLFKLIPQIKNQIILFTNNINNVINKMVKKFDPHIYCEYYVILGEEKNENNIRVNHISNMFRLDYDAPITLETRNRNLPDNILREITIEDFYKYITPAEKPYGSNFFKISFSAESTDFMNNTCWHFNYKLKEKIPVHRTVLKIYNLPKNSHLFASMLVNPDINSKIIPKIIPIKQIPPYSYLREPPPKKYYGMSLEDYGLLDPSVRRKFSRKETKTNEFMIGYLFDKLLINDSENMLIKPEMFRSFNNLAQTTSRYYL